MADGIPTKGLAEEEEAHLSIKTDEQILESNAGPKPPEKALNRVQSLNLLWVPSLLTDHSHSKSTAKYLQAFTSLTILFCYPSASSHITSIAC